MLVTADCDGLTGVLDSGLAHHPPLLTLLVRHPKGGEIAQSKVGLGQMNKAATGETSIREVQCETLDANGLVRFSQSLRSDRGPMGNWIPSCLNRTRPQSLKDGCWAVLATSRQLWG